MENKNTDLLSPVGSLPDAMTAEIEAQADRHLDLKGVKCPMNFVRLKLMLEEMGDDQNLEVILDAGEPMRNVPRSVNEEGHRITKVDKLAGDSFKLLIKKGGVT
jgi:tRNA 2-thiouridine synthesizing protein A